ncbi:GNAT family N-acetyltransferase [Arthrobacter sp. 2MCAF14]|uniref:GNAT family N-acetyltransferase n=1 Tax=Arthrobacter sp. 2MCAF14 TaxID=3232982 RepID=UPI003F8EAE93
MKELTTDRLWLRRFTSDDSDFIFDMYSRWEVQRFIGLTPRLMTERVEADERTARYAAVEHPVHGIWAITDKSTGQRLGVLLLKPLPASGSETQPGPSCEIEIGWHLHPDAWGQGYTSEGAEAVLAHAFATGLNRVLAVTNKNNVASQAVARRIGMTRTGTTADFYNTECELFSIERE